MAVYVLLDVGGTTIKGGITDEQGHMLGTMEEFPSMAHMDKEVILDHFLSVIHTLWEKGQGEQLAGIGMAFPGPFDFQKGISFMKGLDKYDSIYGVEIPDALKKRDQRLKDVKFLFLHDVEAFAVGTCGMGKAAGYEKVFCLCIGTGTGSAFVENKVVLKQKSHHIPENGWIYCLPFRDSVIDDYISVRGLRKLSEQILGRGFNGKELFSLCRQGNLQAQKVYELFGDDLENAMNPFLDAFCPTALVMGGQISKSWEYFGKKLGNACENRNIRIIMEENTSLRAMQGLFITMGKGK